MNIIEQTIINIFKLPKLDSNEIQMVNFKNNKYMDSKKNKNKVKKKGFFRRIFKK